MSLVAQNPNSSPVVQELTISQKFVKKVATQFEASMGSPLSWTPLQMSLAQNLYIKLDQSLQELEQKRAGNNYKKNDPPITWDNLNMDKLSKDAVARVRMGLDAQLPNHIHVIPYLNSRTKKYDVDLRIGYKGTDHVHRNYAMQPPLDIKYQLVHETDIFKLVIENGVEMPYFEQTSPFNPGAVIGGYGYITYDDPRRNKVIICEYREFEKAMKASKGVEFWGGIQSSWVDGKKVEGEYDEKFMKEMMFKTLVFRVCKHIQLDPTKINSTEMRAISAAELDVIEAEMAEEVEQLGNQTQLSLSAPVMPVAQVQTVQQVAEEVPVGGQQNLGGGGGPDF